MGRQERKPPAGRLSNHPKSCLSYDGLLTALDDELWQSLIPKTFARRMAWLIEVAGNYNRARHRKAVRGLKKKPPLKSKYRNSHHLSVKKILDARAAAKTC